MLGKANVCDWYKEQNHQDPCLMSLKKSLRELGLDVIWVEAATAEENACARRKHRVPQLTLYFRTQAGYDALDIPERENNWQDVYFQTEAIRDLWREICREEGITGNYYLPDMFLFLHSYPKQWLVDWVFKNEDRVTVLTGTQVYCSSTPSLRVVYRTQEDYQREQRRFPKLREDILDLLREEAPRPHREELERLLKIEFWHREMPGYSGYGFARRD